MKKLLLFAIAVTIPVAAQAAVSVDQTTTPEQLMKNGFSKQTADIISISKARATGQEYYTDDEKAFKKQNAFVKFWRKLYVYADPAAEDYSYYHHNTDTSPSYTDL